VSQTQAAELLEAVRTFLREDVVPQLEGFSAYTARVAANSLAIALRELELGDGLEQIDAQAAARFGIDPDEGPVAQQLAVRLRDGAIQPDPDFVAYLKRRTLKALEIDNPKYSGYLQALASWGPEG
jgi:hypothetical protein